jgi:uncharacterized protein
MSVADELQRLQQMRDSGEISEEEFAEAKAKLLASPTGGLDGLFGGTNTNQPTRLWAMILHLSQLIPALGLVVPIVIWQLLKTKMPAIDEHGKIVANWIVSAILYAVGLVVIGVPLFCMIPPLAVVAWPLSMVLWALNIVFPIMGGIKANNGEAWKYPLSISFFK